MANGMVGSSKCKIKCDTDADCPGLEHCCSNGCGAQCSIPVIEGILYYQYGTCCVNIINNTIMIILQMLMISLATMNIKVN